MKASYLGLLAALPMCIPWTAFCAEPLPVSCSVQLTVTSELPCAKVPMDPVIDFAELIRQLDVNGVLDPNSIVVVNLATNQPIPHATGEDFAYGDPAAGWNG